MDIYRNTRIQQVALLLSLAMLAGSASRADAMHDAVQSGDLPKVQQLVVSGSDVNRMGVNDETPLIVASLEGQGEIANYLLQRGAKIDARNAGGLSALHAAAYAGHRDIVALLLTKGADVNDGANQYGVTPLHLAAEENHLAVVELLLKHGADPTAVERNGYTALTRAGWREHWDVAAILIANGAACQPADRVGDWLYKECTSRTIKH